MKIINLLLSLKRTGLIYLFVGLLCVVSCMTAVSARCDPHHKALTAFTLPGTGIVALEKWRRTGEKQYTVTYPYSKLPSKIYTIIRSDFIGGRNGVVVYDNEIWEFFIPYKETPLPIPGATNEVWISARNTSIQGEWRDRWRSATEIEWHTSWSQALADARTVEQQRNTFANKSQPPGSFWLRPGQGGFNHFYSRNNPENVWTVVSYGYSTQTDYLGKGTRSTLNGVRGTIVRDITYMETAQRYVFIPDLGSPEMRVMFGHNNVWTETVRYSNRRYPMGEVAPLNQSTINQIKVERARAARQKADEQLRQQFFSAIRRGNTAEIQTLLRKKPTLISSTDPVSKTTKTPFQVSMDSRQLPTAKFLLSKGASKAQINTMLFHAVGRQDEATATFLLSNGASVNARDHMNGETPLHYAVRGHSKRMALYLKNRGANLRATNSNGYTPSELATLLRNPVLANLLRP